MPLVAAGSQVTRIAALLNEARTGQEAAARTPRAVAERQHALTAGPGHQDQNEPAAFLPADAIWLAQLETIIARALTVYDRSWPSAGSGPASLTVLVAVSRVIGLVPGVYVVGHTDGIGLTRLADCGDDIDPAKYGNAAAALHICGDLADACRGGVPGYGTLLVRAGMLGHAAWLSAQSAGLAGATYAMASRHVTGIARDADPALRHLMSVALGAGSGRAESRPGASREVR